MASDQGLHFHSSSSIISDTPIGSKIDVSNFRTSMAKSKGVSILRVNIVTHIRTDVQTSDLKLNLCLMINKSTYVLFNPMKGCQVIAQKSIFSIL